MNRRLVAPPTGTECARTGAFGELKESRLDANDQAPIDRLFTTVLLAMPILPAEPDVFPSDLLDRPVGGTSWWVLYTLARREKELMRRLMVVQIPFYSPLIRKRSRSPAGRTRTSFVPLFPGYVFLQGDDDQRRIALGTHCVSQCIQVVDSKRLVCDLRQIRQLIESDVPLTPEERLEAGQRVRVRGGPLTGLEGTIVKRHGQQRLLVAVEFLQRGASVQLEDFAVERID